MERLLTQLRGLPAVSVQEIDSAWSVRVTKDDGLVVELTIPREVLEWFVEAHDKGGTKIWSDWVDYRGYEPDEDVARLTAEMSEDIHRFVATLLQATAFRVARKPSLLGSRSAAEWQVEGRWQDVWGVETSSEGVCGRTSG